MSTAIFFHAHPDDESILTSGTMALLAAAGHRVVLVTATDGSQGEVAEGFLNPGETLAERRSLELQASAAAIGIARVVPMGYLDSGMAGTASNDDPRCFHQADTDQAAERLVAIMREEHASVLVIYDDHGNYGHPDHVKVHVVGMRAAQLVAVPNCYLATVNRDRAQEQFGRGRPEMPPEEAERMAEFLTIIGVPDAEITTAIDVSGFLAQKRLSMEAHRSQIDPNSWPLSLPEEIFAESFATEWYVHVGADPLAPRETSLEFSDA